MHVPWVRQHQYIAKVAVQMSETGENKYSPARWDDPLYVVHHDLFADSAVLICNPKSATPLSRVDSNKPTTVEFDHMSPSPAPPFRFKCEVFRQFWLFGLLRFIIGDLQLSAVNGYGSPPVGIDQASDCGRIQSVHRIDVPTRRRCLRHKLRILSSDQRDCKQT